MIWPETLLCVHHLLRGCNAIALQRFSARHRLRSSGLTTIGLCACTLHVRRQKLAAAVWFRSLGIGFNHDGQSHAHCPCATSAELCLKAGAAEDSNATTRLVGPQASSEGANLGDAPLPTLETSVSHPAVGAATGPGAHTEIVADRHGPPMTTPDAMADASNRPACANCWLILAMEQRLHLYHGSMWCLGQAELSSSQQKTSPQSAD